MRCSGWHTVPQQSLRHRTRAGRARRQHQSRSFVAGWLTVHPGLEERDVHRSEPMTCSDGQCLDLPRHPQVARQQPRSPSTPEQHDVGSAVAPTGAPQPALQLGLLADVVEDEDRRTL